MVVNSGLRGNSGGGLVFYSDLRGMGGTARLKGSHFETPQNILNLGVVRPASRAGSGDASLDRGISTAVGIDGKRDR